MTDAPAVPGAASAWSFDLDRFQREAIDRFDDGDSVLVAAPTGSGKTVVAEHAIAVALSRGGKAFYTTPLKALSNQKYTDLVRRHGAPNVGLLTGDVSNNGEAPVVVMTTEVLRNMIHAASPTLEGVQVVVLDEIHFLQDAYRGPVWEEVIIHLDHEVRLVCLSATVANAADLAEWISTVRGPTDVVIEDRRPVELRNLYLAAERGVERLHLLPTLRGGRANPGAARIDAEAVRGPRHHRGRDEGRRLATPGRVDVIDRLEEEAMLPAIVFVFSRAGCDDAVRQCLDAGVRLTTPDERLQIRQLCEARVEGLTDEDLEVLGWPRWIAGMEAGLASHHAGMVPAFKEAVEDCFSAGLVKVVYATETLAVGINMPARTVVIEQLTKFRGDRHQFLTPTEYTQLTGRAGRRGIDDRGHAVVLWSPWVTFEQVAELARASPGSISSAFRPTYNMTANLVDRHDRDTARHLLNLSFGQFQADREIVRAEARIDRARQRAGAARAALQCERGDVESLLSLERRLGEQRNLGSARRAVESAMAGLRPGDVIRLPGGTRTAAVLTSARRRGSVQLRVVTVERQRLALGPADFDDPPVVVATVDLPTPYEPNRPSFQRTVAKDLGRLRVRGDQGRRPPPRQGPTVDPGIATLQQAVADHPVSSCPDLAAHRRAWTQVVRAEREVHHLEQQVHGRSAALSLQFDAVLSVLEAWEYVQGWTVTPKGRVLTRVYHETDLLVAECVARGWFDELAPPAVAGLAAAFVYTRRGPGDDPEPWFPDRQLRTRWTAVEEIHRELNALEAEAGVPLTRELDPGFVGLAFEWASGLDLAAVLEDEDISGGDFVRTVKQVADLLRQIAEVAQRPDTRAAARQAAGAIERGVVAAASSVGAG